MGLDVHQLLVFQLLALGLGPDLVQLLLQGADLSLDLSQLCAVVALGLGQGALQRVFLWFGKMVLEDITVPTQKKPLRRIILPQGDHSHPGPWRLLLGKCLPCKHVNLGAIPNTYTKSQVRLRACNPRVGEMETGCL